MNLMILILRLLGRAQAPGCVKRVSVIKTLRLQFLLLPQIHASVLKDVLQRAVVEGTLLICSARTEVQPVSFVSLQGMVLLL